MNRQILHLAIPNKTLFPPKAIRIEFIYLPEKGK